MKAVSGKSAQKVGWTFTVQRAIVGVDSQMPWENRYTSAEMTATTDAAHNAAFSSASVRVIVPDKPGSAGAASIYRVMVTLFWHRSDGTVSGSVRWRVDTYRYQSDTGQAGTRAKNCESYLY